MENIMQTITSLQKHEKSYAVYLDDGQKCRAQFKVGDVLGEGKSYDFVIENQPYNGNDVLWIKSANEAKGGNGSAPSVSTAAPAPQGFVDLRQESIELQSSADRILSRFPVFSNFKKFNEKSVREMYCNAALWGYLGLQDAKAVLAASRNLDKKEDESGGDLGNDEEIPF